MLNRTYMINNHFIQTQKEDKMPEINPDTLPR